MPTGNYTNVRVKILNDTEELANVFGGSYTIARKDLKKLSISAERLPVAKPRLYLLCLRLPVL